MPDNDFCLTIRLIQQTPIIHFQYNDSGATLRASEVKPKLDRYLIKHCKGIIKDDMYLKVDKTQTKALNYKMRFTCVKSDVIPIGKGTLYDIYYGKTDKMQALQAEGSVKCEIICMNKNLISIIKNNIGDFFAVSNFGYMQRKGFGSYIEENYNKGEAQIAELLREEYGSERCYVFAGGKYAFKRIKTLNGLMKSGYNFRKYHRSLLFRYMNDKFRIANEKAGLKSSGLVPAVYSNKDRANKKACELSKSSNQEGYYYVRALLGFSEKYEYNIKEGQYIITNNVVKTADQSPWKGVSKVVIGVRDKEKDEIKKIERLESPIFFKVINDRIYCVGEQINAEIFGCEFEFYQKNESNEQIKNISFQTPLQKTICKEEMGLNETNFTDKFLEYVFDKVNVGEFDNVTDIIGLRADVYPEKGRENEREHRNGI